MSITNYYYYICIDIAIVYIIKLTVRFFIVTSVLLNYPTIDLKFNIDKQKLEKK